jgi:trans-aconitate methyltransferase
LQLEQNHILVDLGCGTGIYSQEILRQKDLTKSILCVDSSAEMLSQIPSDERLKVIDLDGLAFLKKQ